MANVKLPRLPVNWQSQPELVRRYWDSTMSEIEKTLNAILAIPAIEEALKNLDEAVANANDAAAAANAAANSAKQNESLVNSYITAFTAPLISADSSGVVTIANHTRVYGDSSLNPSRTVVGGTISTGAASGSIVRVYYSDPSRAGGSVAYLFTVDPATPMAQGGNIHSIGAVAIPATGTGDGNFVKPPGFVEA